MTSRNGVEIIGLGWMQDPQEILVRWGSDTSKMTDHGIDMKFYDLPGPQTLEEAEEYDQGDRVPSFGMSDAGVFTGTTKDSMIAHSRLISREIGRPVKLVIPDLPKVWQDRRFLDDQEIWEEDHPPQRRYRNGRWRK